MKRLLTQAEVAESLSISEGTLERDRWAGARIPFIKIGRSVRYDPDEIERFKKANTRRSTSDGGSTATEAQTAPNDLPAKSRRTGNKRIKSSA